jgi:hypothetical protein
MRGLLDALKGDLTDRRLRGVVIAVAVLLVAGVGYAILGGGSQSASPTASAGPVSSGTGAVPSAAQASSATNAKAAAAETTYGASGQHHGKVVDPFVELSTTTSTTSAAGKTTPSSGSSGSTKTTTPASSTSAPSKSASPSSGSSGSSGASSHSSTPATPPPPPPKPKTQTEYRVDVEFGPAPANASETPKLTAYKEVKIGQNLPSKSHPLVQLKAASLGKSARSFGATFALISSPIVNGPGTCLPSDTQCELVKLGNGQLEELQYAETNGQTVAYLLRVSKVVARTVTSG